MYSSTKEFSPTNVPGLGTMGKFWIWKIIHAYLSKLLALERAPNERFLPHQHCSLHNSNKFLCKMRAVFEKEKERMQERESSAILYYRYRSRYCRSIFCFRLSERDDGRTNKAKAGLPGMKESLPYIYLRTLR